MRTVLGIMVIGVLMVLAAPWRGLIREQQSTQDVHEVEMAVFEAGFGADWQKDVARAFERKREAAGHPVRVNVWGDPRVVDRMRPRILARRPPAIVEAYLPFWTLVLSDVLLPMDDVLDRPAPGREGATIREMFYPGALDPYSYRGKVYALPHAYDAWVIWYDRNLFRRHGWQVPGTWDELLALCEQMKRSGIEAVAFQGKYAVYSSAYFWHLVQSIGGIELFDRCQALEPGAFIDADTVEAARRFQQFAVNCFQSGSLTMTHTEAQNEFCQGRAGLVACGLFFENEMQHVFPEEFELSAFKLPPIEGGKGDPNAIYGGPSEPIHLFRDAPDTDDAQDLLAELLRVDHMTRFASEKNTLVAIAPANRAADLSPAMAHVRDIVEGCTFRYKDYLDSYALTWETQYRRPLIDRLMRGEITPEVFCEGLETGAEAMRANPDFVRPELAIRRNPS